MKWSCCFWKSKRKKAAEMAHPQWLCYLHYHKERKKNSLLALGCCSVCRCSGSGPGRWGRADDQADGTRDAHGSGGADDGSTARESQPVAAPGSGAAGFSAPVRLPSASLWLWGARRQKPPGQDQALCFCKLGTLLKTKTNKLSFIFFFKWKEKWPPWHSG